MTLRREEGEEHSCFSRISSGEHSDGITSLWVYKPVDKTGFKRPRLISKWQDAEPMGSNLLGKSANVE